MTVHEPCYDDHVLQGEPDLSFVHCAAGGPWPCPEANDDTPDPSWRERDGYVVAPLDWKGAK